MQKKDVQPFISASTKKLIFKLKFISKKSVKQICEEICSIVLKREEFINQLQPYLKDEVNIGGILYQPNEIPLQQYRPSEDLERITIKVDAQDYEFAYNLTYSLNWSVAAVFAFCIEQIMNNYEFLESYTSKILDNELGERRKETFISMVRDTNSDSDLDEELSVASLLLGIVDEVKYVEESLSDTVDRIAENW